jgi:uncharacterized protein YndB with AHSA1/START domain
MSEVVRSIEVNASPAKVWELIGVFEAVHKWHPSAVDCARIEQDGKIQRHIILANGHGEIMELLEAHDDQTMSYRYGILESPMPVTDYHATLSVEPDSVGARVTWSVNYQPVGISEEDADQIIVGIFETGLNAIKQNFA